MNEIDIYRQLHFAASEPNLVSYVAGEASDSDMKCWLDALADWPHSCDGHSMKIIRVKLQTLKTFAERIMDSANSSGRLQFDREPLGGSGQDLANLDPDDTRNDELQAYFEQHGTTGPNHMTIIRDRLLEIGGEEIGRNPKQ